MNLIPLLAETPSQTIFVVGGIAANLFVFFVIAAIWMSRYTKVGPDQVLVISGRKYMVKDPEGKVRTVGFRMVKGGGAFVWPVYEKCAVLSLKPVPVELNIPGILTRDGSKAAVVAKSQVRLRPDDLSLARAVQSLLGQTPEQMKDTVSQLMESSLRSLLGGWTVSEISQRQSQLAAEWGKAVEEPLGNLGLALMSLSVRDVKYQG
jgi:flotillin